MSAEEGVPPSDAENKVDQPVQCKPRPGDASNEARLMAARMAALESRVDNLEMTIHFLVEAEELSMPLRMRQHMITPDHKLRPKQKILRLGDIEELEVLLAICGFLLPKELAKLACVSRCFGRRIAWAADDGTEPEWRSIVEESARRWVLEHQGAWVWDVAQGEDKSWMYRMQDVLGWPASFADAHPDIVLSKDGAVATMTPDTHFGTPALRTVAGRRVLGEGHLGLHYAVFTLLNHSSFAIRDCYLPFHGVYIGVVTDNCDVQGGAPNIPWLYDGTRFFHTAGRVDDPCRRGDRVGLLLDTHEGTLEVFKNDVRLGVLHRPSEDDNDLAHRVFKAKGCGGYRWAVSMGNEGQCVRIEGCAIPAGILKERVARRRHVALLVPGVVVMFRHDLRLKWSQFPGGPAALGFVGISSYNEVGEILEVKDYSPWQKGVRFSHKKEPLWMRADFLELATPEQEEQWWKLQQVEQHHLTVEAQAVKEQEQAIDVELSKTLAQIAALDGSGQSPEPDAMQSHVLIVMKGGPNTRDPLKFSTTIDSLDGLKAQLRKELDVKTDSLDVLVHTADGKYELLHDIKELPKKARVMLREPT